MSIYPLYPSTISPSTHPPLPCLFILYLSAILYPPTHILYPLSNSLSIHPSSIYPPILWTPPILSLSLSCFYPQSIHPIPLSIYHYPVIYPSTTHPLSNPPNMTIHPLFSVAIHPPILCQSLPLCPSTHPLSIYPFLYLYVPWHKCTLE